MLSLFSKIAQRLGLAHSARAPIPVLNLEPTSEQAIETPNFVSLRASGAFDIRWSPGAPSLRLCGAASDVATVECFVASGQLTLRSHRNAQSNATISQGVIVAECSSPSLAGLSLSGAVSFEASGAALTQPTLELSGSSQCQASFVGALRARLRGAAQADLEGCGAYGAQIDASGSSSICIDGGQAVGAKIDLQGASSARLPLQGEASVRASGAASLKYSGSPIFSRRELSGAASLKPLNQSAPR